MPTHLLITRYEDNSKKKSNKYKNNCIEASRDGNAKKQVVGMITNAVGILHHVLTYTQHRLTHTHTL